VTTLLVEEITRLGAISELCLKLAGERDLEVLLQGVTHLARQIVPSQYASVGILEEHGQTISGRVFSSGMDAASGMVATAVMPAIPVLRAALLANMLETRRALRLRDVASESLGFNLLPEVHHLSSALGVPLFNSLRVWGFLLFANKFDADEFTDQDEQLVVALAGHVTLAYERMEEQRRAHAEMVESWDVLEALFELAPDAFVVASEDGRIVRVNAQTEELFGYTRDELVAQPVDILVPGWFRKAHPARREQYSARPHRRPMGEGLELSGRCRDASEFAADIMLSRIETKRGKLTKIVIRDGTAHVKMAEHIQQLNRSLEKHVEELETANQELETFSYSVSHHLRAPLRQIDGFARILREQMGPQSDPDNSHYLKRIQDAATNMGHLLEGLLDLARLGRQGLRVQVTDLNLLAREVIKELKLEVPNRQIEWILDLLPMINCDSVLVKAVFSNLLSNAVKFTRLRECAIIRIGQRLENGETVIFVGDNGVGFNMKYADKLFGIFQRLYRSEDFPGTGIGLATVQRVIKKHGGRIWAEAELNSGATFHFTLLPGEVEQAEGSKHENEVLHEV
jgi:PAS domain S-box-containing protein